jgi:hypothetical protein
MVRLLVASMIRGRGEVRFFFQLARDWGRG